MHDPGPTLRGMSPLPFTLLFIVAVLTSTLTRLWLASRQIRHVAAHRSAVPEPFQGSVSQAAHARAAAYTLDKGRFGLLTTAIDAGLLVGWTLLGGLDVLNSALLAHVRPWAGDMGYQLALLGSFALLSSLLDLPFEIYRVFRIEQRHGFNRLTPRTMAADALRTLLVSLVLGLPIAALVLWIMGTAGTAWWLWAWAAWMSFNLLLLVIYPTVIAPLYNRFEPLADSALVTRVQALMARCGFSAKGLFVMDGSKRSAHANAYFTGFGAAKRVVFFDTLLNKLSGAEVEAVLAHELGHFTHRHVLKRIVSMAAISLAALALLGWLSRQPIFYTALGTDPAVGAPNDALALVLFMLVVPVLGIFVSPWMAGVSRKHEFEADAYACRQADGQALSSALLKLHEDNAATLTPDPVYVRFYYSHPPALERLAALQRETRRRGAASVAPTATGTA